jgi:hypothetical protein
MGLFDVPDDSEWISPGRMYVVARGYDVRQIVRQTAWRPSLSSPHDYTAAGSEELRIQKFGKGNILHR